MTFQSREEVLERGKRVLEQMRIAPDTPRTEVAYMVNQARRERYRQQQEEQQRQLQQQQQQEQERAVQNWRASSGLFPAISPESSVSPLPGADAKTTIAALQAANDYAKSRQRQTWTPPSQLDLTLAADTSPRTREAKLQNNTVAQNIVNRDKAIHEESMAAAKQVEETRKSWDAMSFEDVNAEYEQRKADYAARRNAYGRDVVAKTGNRAEAQAVYNQAIAQFDAGERGRLEALKRYIQDRWETKESDEAKFAAHVAEVQNAPDFEEKAPSWKNYNQRTVSALFGATNQDEAAYYQFSKHATELEKKTFLYLLETEGKKAAKQYLKSVFPTINARSNEELEQKLTPYVGDSWIENAAKRLGGAGLSILAGTAGTAAYLGESAGQLFSNAGKEWYEQEHGIQEDSMTANLFQQRNIGTEAVLQGTSGVGRFVASLALSGVENGVDFLLFQGAAPYIMSLKAGSQGAYNVYERGGTAEQQGSAFLCNAAAELLGEKVSFNKLKQVLADPSTGLNAWLRRWGAQSLSESGEEMATEVMNIISDIAIMKDDAEVAQKLDQMIAEGKKNPELALAISVALQLLQAGAAGGLTSAIMTGAPAALHFGAEKLNQGAQAVLDARAKQELSKAISAENRASSVPASELSENQPAVPETKASAALRAVAQGQQISGKQADAILDDPAALAELERMTGQTIDTTNMTKAQQRAAVKNAKAITTPDGIQAMRTGESSPDLTPEQQPYYDSLQVAKKMKAEGKTGNEIFSATQWVSMNNQWAYNFENILPSGESADIILAKDGEINGSQQRGLEMGASPLSEVSGDVGGGIGEGSGRRSGILRTEGQRSWEAATDTERTRITELASPHFSTQEAQKLLNKSGSPEALAAAIVNDYSKGRVVAERWANIVSDFDGLLSEIDGVFDPDSDIQASRVSADQWTTDSSSETSSNGKAQKPRSLSDVISKVGRWLNITYSQDGTHLNQAAGEFMTRSENVHTKERNDLPVFLHEVGHQLDKRYQLTKNAPDDVRTELLSGLSAQMKRAYPSTEHLTEGLAEFFRKAFKSVSTAQTNYAKTIEYLQSRIGKSDPKALKALNRAFSYANQYFGSNFQTRVDLFFNPTTDKPTITERLATHDAIVHMAEKFVYNWTDDLIGLRMFSKAVDDPSVEQIGRDVRRSVGMADSMITREMTDLNGQKVGKSLQSCFSSNGLDFYDMAHRRLLNNYAGVRHSLDLMNRGIQVYADADFTVQNLQDYLSQLESETPGIRKAADDLCAFVRNVRDHVLVPSGLISADDAAKWDKQSPHYVPMQRFFENDNSIGNLKRKGGSETTVHRQTGSTREVNPIIDNVMEWTFQAVHAAKINRARVTVADACLLNQGMGIYMERAPKQMKRESLKSDQASETIRKNAQTQMQQAGMRDQYIDMVDNIIRQSIPDVLERYTKQERRGGDIVNIYRNGKAESWRVHDWALMEAFEAMKPETCNAFVRFVANMNRQFTKFVTTGNPAFNVASNPPRDALTAYATSDSPLQAARLVGMIVKNTKSLFQELFSGSADDPFVREYFARGGFSDGSIADINAHYDTDQTRVGQIKSSKVYVGAQKAKQKASNWYNNSAGAVEQYLRVGEFTRCRKAGLSIEESMMRAQNITTDFSRGGKIAKKVNKFVPFFNAGIQGLAKDYRFLTGADPENGNRKTTAVKRLTHYALSSVALGLFEVFAGAGFDPDDEEAKEAYARLSTYQKNNSFCIYLGRFNDEWKGKFLTIRKPREIGILTSLTARMIEEHYYDNENAMYDFFGYSMDQMLPKLLDAAYLIPAAMKSTDDNNAFWGTLANSLGWFGSPLGALMNTDYLGNTIVPANLQDVEPWKQYTGNTSKFAVTLGKLLNWSPMKIDYAMKNLGFLQTTQQSLFPYEGGGSFSLGAVKDSLYSQDTVSRFYNQRQEITIMANTYPEEYEYTVQQASFDRMARFYSKANELLQKSSTTGDVNTRDARATMLQTLEQFLDDNGNGKYSATVKAIQNIAAEVEDTSILASTLDSQIKINGFTTQLTYADYYDYQTTYLANYYAFAEPIVQSDASAEEKAAALKRVSAAAKKVALAKLQETATKYWQ